MTILLLANLIPTKTGAFERFVAALGAALRARGHHLVAAFGGSPSPPVAALLDEAGVTVEVIPGWSAGPAGVHPWAVVRPGWRLIRRLRPDTVALHFGNELPAAWLALAGRLTGPRGIRWIWHQRQQIRPPRTWLQRHGARIRLPALLGYRFVALYRGGEASLRARGIPAARIAVIPNGVPPAPAATGGAARLRALAGADETAPCVVNVSSLIPRKRVDLTIKAFAGAVQALRKTGHHAAAVRLILIGEGPVESALREAVSRTGLEEAVCFAGRRDDVRDLLAGADVLLLGSEAEACPWAILEAMAAGVPVIATAAGAAAELIDPGVTGWIVPCGDAAAMTDRLTALLTDPGQRDRFGNAARDRWQASYTESVMIQRHLTCYTGITQGET